MSYENILEEELKNKVAQHYFTDFDCSRIIGKIDFVVTTKTTRGQAALHEPQSLLWAEAKKDKADIYYSIVQLILTIGKARTFDTHLPPPFLGAFDAHQIAFIPYDAIYEIFYQNDFNWNVTPSNYKTKEFALVLEKVKTTIDDNSMIYNFLADEKELKAFIKNNFIEGKQQTTKTRIDKNNFMVVYNKWLTAVKPSIGMAWDIAKKYNIIDGDFYLADLLSDENKSLKEKLSVILLGDRYQLERKIDEMGMFNAKTATFNDNQKAHTQFWNRYERPPQPEYWDYISGRRDLLVPQDVRERKGSFYTPQIWVELSQKYLADTLGVDWQDEYYIWDCACGTGNLLAGLTNKYNIWASTLDKQDVDVIHDRIKNGTNLLESHVFQFDFLNDDFTKLPQGLQDIINDPEKRKKLVVYINPPYAEAGSVSVIGDRKNKTEVATNNKIWLQYKDRLGMGIREIFAQFLIRIYCEIPTATIANFSKLKNLQSSAFHDFRILFRAKLEKIFLVPADTFDNVKGQFPIGFMIWNTTIFNQSYPIISDVYNSHSELIGKKLLYNPSSINNKTITEWITQYSIKQNTNILGYTGNNGPDFQNSNYCYLGSTQKTNNNGTLNNATKYSITKENFKFICIYFAVRHCIAADWLNDRDQFLYPNEGWQTDTEFQNDCLAFTLFHGQNRITSADGTNHWIPFTEQEVNARDKFDSNFMTRYIAGKIETTANTSELFGQANSSQNSSPLLFSNEAKAVFDAGRALWQYYHALPNCNVNAALYDIRAHFQERNAAGKMNHKSNDPQYNQLIKALRDSLKPLAEKIAEKVYTHGFLKG